MRNVPKRVGITSVLRRWTIPVLALTMPINAGYAQQDEWRLEDMDPGACLIAVQDAQCFVRNQLEDLCTRIPSGMCMGLRPDGHGRCMDELAGLYVTFLLAVRDDLPATIEGSPFATDQYSGTVARLRAIDGNDIGIGCNEARFPPGCRVNYLGRLASMTMNAARLAGITVE